MAAAKQRAAKRPPRKTVKKSKAKAAVPVQKSEKVTKAAPEHKAQAPAPDKSQTERQRLPTAWSIGRKAVRLILSHKMLFGGMLLIYILLSLVLIRAFSNNINIPGLKNLLKGNFTGTFSGIWTGLSIYTVIIAGSNSAASAITITYQTLLSIIISLATIWGLRQARVAGDAKIRIRDMFYKGMYPLIPVLLVLLVVLLELIPFIICAYIYGVVMSTGVAVHFYEKAIWILVLIAGIGATGYLLTSSLIAVYIATLPNMEPVKALRSASRLVKGRRLTVVRKLLALPLGLFIGSAIIMVPLILIFSSAAPIVFFFISLLSLMLTHAYMYTLYRELII